MIVCSFSEVKCEIAQHIKDRRLIPILGSGFSVGSLSANGKVPSGKEMLSYMKQAIMAGSNEPGRIDSLEKKTFSQISTYYHKRVPLDMRRRYIRDNFTKVVLESPRREFLDQIEWLYIYTLNMDDAIEKNSEYNQIIVSNREVVITALSDYKCTIKLHGDANSYLIYNDDSSQIFDFKQYAQSIARNETLLSKLQDDFTYNNLVFIGCSLDGEYDLASIDSYQRQNSYSKTSKYYCTTTSPDEFKMYN